MRLHDSRQARLSLILLSCRCALSACSNQSMASTHALTDSMKNITKSMVALNKATNMPELSKIMQEFAKQSEQMEMKQEVRFNCKRIGRVQQQRMLS